MNLLRIALIILITTNAAYAGDWTTYSNPRFGETIDIPPGFVNDVPAPANGDGLTYHSANGDAELLVWGNNLVVGNFEEDALERLASERADKWIVSSERSSNADLKKT
jgi:hypothetical protein